MGFFGDNFWSRDFLGVLLEALGIFLGFDFCPQSIRHLKSGVLSPRDLIESLLNNELKYNP